MTTPRPLPAPRPVSAAGPQGDAPERPAAGTPGPVAARPPQLDTAPVVAATPERPWSPLLFPAITGTPPAVSWRSETLPLGRLVRPEPDPAHQLFAPRSSPAILHLAVAQWAPDGPVDVEALTDRVARCEPIVTLPRRLTRTLRFGVDVLVDTSDGMALFARDVRDLLTQIERVAGAGQVTRHRFAYAPLRGAGPGPRRDWRAYRPGSARVRVVVLSDFGMGGPVLDHRRATVDEWAAFTHELRRYGAEAIAITPYPRRLWPRWLPTLFQTLPWDRNVTVGQVSARLAGR